MASSTTSDWPASMGSGPRRPHGDIRMTNPITNMESQSQPAPGAHQSTRDALVDIWAEVLRLPLVEVDANFFDIGGDSLKAMEVIMRVGEVLQAELPLMAFFEDPTVAHLAAVIDEAKGTGTTALLERTP